MKIPKLFASAGVAVLVMATPSFATTVITNSGFAANNQDIPNTSNNASANGTATISTYASNAAAADANWTVAPGLLGVVGTPNIALNWTTGLFQTYTAWNGRGNVIQLDSFTGAISPNFNVAFAPASSAGVNITSFDLDAFAGSPNGDVTVNWSITDTANTTVYSNGVFTRTAAAGGRGTIAPNYTGITGQTLVLRLNQTGGDGSYLAMDNLTFDQVGNVPEPATAAYFLVGAASLFFWRGHALKRKSKSSV